MRSRLLALLACAAGLLALAAGPALAQGRGGQATPAAPPINQSDDPVLRTFTWRSIGPASMGGRIDDIEAVESNPSVIYLGYATGGVWKSVNNGTTWTPLFDTFEVSSVGDIGLSQSNPNVVYVGTGEPNNRQSSSFGNGMYKSTDGGKTFTHIGLTETQTIARVVVHPRNPDVVYVAALGHLFGPNPERGLYKTSDGGRTWQAIKQIDADTGFTDIAMDPSDPDVLYAASYQRRRQPFGFNGGGPGSAIWKTTNGGRTWTKLEGNGLPTGLLGRIGLAVSRSNPRVVYAQMEVGASAGTGGNVTDDGKPVQPGAGRGAGAGRAGGAGGQQEEAPPDPARSGVWRSDDGGRTWRVMSNNNNRPMYYSQIRVDPTNPDIVYTMGAPFFKSTDGGRTFNQVQGIAHSDHHALWINPRNPNHLVLGNDGGLDVSYDQGATWEFVNTIATGQFYAIGADMRKPYIVCGGLQDNGSWCGPSAVRSGNGIMNTDWYRVGGGDGFYTLIDPTDWTTVYSESQDGNVGRTDLKTGQRANIRPRAAQAPRRGQQTPEQQQQAEQQALMQRMAAQMGFGGAGGGANIVPAPEPGTQFRFFWNTPLHLSPHNPRMLYIGGNRLFISRDRGDTFTMTEDLTRNVDRFARSIMGVDGMAPMASKHDGAGTNSVITTVAESPVVPGVLWVGTDDGNLQVSQDGGVNWTNVASNVPGVPDGTFVSRVEPSHFDAATCYVTFDGHRTDDHAPYVYATKDYGRTWTSIVANLPPGNANVIREDLKNPDLLFLGTEYFFFTSLDRGRTWKRFSTALPTVRIDDILIHPRDNDLIVGTHGRSIWIIDDITPLQGLTPEVMAKDAHLFDPRPATQWLQDPQKGFQVGGQKHFQGENPRPGTAISYYLKAAATGDVTITISDVTGQVVRTMDGTKDAGLNRVAWDLRRSPPQVPAAMMENVPQQFRGRARQGPAVEPGTYLVKLTVGGKDYTTTVTVEADSLQ